MAYTIAPSDNVLTIPGNLYVAGHFVYQGIDIVPNVTGPTGPGAGSTGPTGAMGATGATGANSTSGNLAVGNWS
jgi:hypothetical protein